jgi:prepilin-type N-terminal cleavage/methylation domain-containing protein
MNFDSNQLGRRQAGFTLIELLVVLAVIAILAATPCVTKGQSPGAGHLMCK